MSRIFWDSNLFIYLIEEAGPVARVREIRDRMLARNDHLLTSALTIGEVLVQPKAQGRDDLAAEYERFIEDAAEVLIFDADAARHYATVRQQRTIRPPDAIQLACASRAGVDLFITNDDRLSKVTVSGIHFITSLDRAFL